MHERRPAHGFFFPAAAAYAAGALPLSVAAMLGAGPPVPGLATPARHAHEMLFGFALAVVAGNQLGPLPRVRLVLLSLAWLAARASFLAAPGSLVAAIANAAFAGLLALHLAPRLGARVRKWRNRALPAAVVALCAAGVAMQVALRLGAYGAQRAALGSGVLVLALLMLFMGGRIIAPAAAGHFLRAGGDLAARVQPRLEGVLVITMALAIAALASGARLACATLISVTAIAGAVRLARWRPWALRRRRDLASLVTGYAWLVVGLAALAASFARDARAIAALHLVTVGAMGTLTLNVMALTWARVARRDPARLAWTPAATALIAAATLARLAAERDAARGAAWLGIAAACWSIAFLVLLAGFASMPGGAGARRT